MRQIYVLLTKYSDWLSAVVCHVSGRGFTHSSISLDEDPDTYYSFNFRGFAVETAEKHRRRGVRNSRCIQLQVSDAAYTRLRMRLLDMLAHRAEYHYTRLGVLFCILRLPFRWKGTISARSSWRSCSGTAARFRCGAPPAAICPTSLPRSCLICPPAGRW